nr:S49 family peptidase [Chelatococcus sp. YT9]
MRRGAGGDDDAGTTRQAFNAQQKPDGSVEYHSPRASRFIGDYRTGPDGRPTPYRVTADGTAIISIIRELVNRGAWVGASSGLVSYEGLSHSLRTAARDPQVSAILLDLESPGGEAGGAFETAALVRKVREEKPVIAMVNGMAASAAYAIASGASRIISIPTGLAGSIGVIMLHIDISEYLAAEGVKPTLIFAGAHKVDGNPYGRLPDAVRARFQKDIDAFYSLFVQCVAAGRKGLSAAAIRSTEAETFLGREAVRRGLADDLGTLEEVIDAKPSRLGRASVRSTSISSTRGSTMTSDTISVSEAHEFIAMTPAAVAAGIDIEAEVRAGASAADLRARLAATGLANGAKTGEAAIVTLARSSAAAAATRQGSDGQVGKSPLVTLAQARADRAHRGRAIL